MDLVCDLIHTKHTQIKMKDGRIFVGTIYGTEKNFIQIMSEKECLTAILNIKDVVSISPSRFY